MYPEDFIVLAEVGEGESGRVKLVKYRRNNKIYALNILKKSNNEKEIKVIIIS